jgi:hypothetical protein
MRERGDASVLATVENGANGGPVSDLEGRCPAAGEPRPPSFGQTVALMAGPAVFFLRGQDLETEKSRA